MSLPLLRPYQPPAVEYLRHHKRALIKSPAGSGKTLIAAAALHAVVTGRARAIPPKIGWIANTLEQCQQARAALALFPMEIDIRIACAQGQPDMSDRDCLVVDEAHHSASPLWRSIIEKCSGAWWGFTATPGEPEQEAVLTDLFGGNLFEITRAQVANNLAAARVVLFDDTDPDLREPIDARIQEELVRFRKFMPKQKVEEEMWPKVAYRVCLEMGIRNNLARNARVADLISRHPLETCLVLVNSKEHGHDLAAGIPGVAAGIPGAVVAHSKMGVRKRREAMAAIVDGSLRCMIATSVLDEGFDCPRATVLVMACGGKAAGRVEQRTGRVLRSFHGKREGIIYDFEDPQHPLLANQARKRQALYHSLGYAVEREADRQPQLL